MYLGMVAHAHVRAGARLGILDMRVTPVANVAHVDTTRVDTRARRFLTSAKIEVIANVQERELALGSHGGLVGLAAWSLALRSLRLASGGWPTRTSSRTLQMWSSPNERIPISLQLSCGKENWAHLSSGWSFH